MVAQRWFLIVGNCPTRDTRHEIRGESATVQRPKQRRVSKSSKVGVNPNSQGRQAGDVARTSAAVNRAYMIPGGLGRITTGWSARRRGRRTSRRRSWPGPRG